MEKTLKLCNLSEFVDFIDTNKLSPFKKSELTPYIINNYNVLNFEIDDFLERCKTYEQKMITVWMNNFLKTQKITSCCLTY